MQLELQYVAKTDSLQPPHNFVPWVVIDGQLLYEVCLFCLLIYGYYRVCRSEQSCSNEQNRFITSISRIVLFEKPQSVCRYCSMVYQFSCKFIIASGGAENLPSQGANIVASAGLTWRV